MHKTNCLKLFLFGYGSTSYITESSTSVEYKLKYQKRKRDKETPKYITISNVIKTSLNGIHLKEIEIGLTFIKYGVI